MCKNCQLAPQDAYLPRCVTKYDLKVYFGCEYTYLWNSLITEEMVEGWGLNWEEEMSRKKRLGPEITQRIYLHYHITNLNANYSQEIAELLAQAAA